jgi:hypothetical protein
MHTVAAPLEPVLAGLDVAVAVRLPAVHERPSDEVLPWI